MAKLLARSKSLKLFHSLDKKENNEESALDSTAARMVSPSSKSPMTSWLESPVDPSLLSQTAKITIFKAPSTTSLHAVRPRTAGETLGKKDWSAMLSTGSPIEIQTENDTFSFPTPLRRPSTASSAVISPRLEGKPTINMSQDSGIGLALGSPSDSNFYFSADMTAASQDIIHGPSRLNGPVRANTTREIHTADDSRPKLSRWRSLGGLFARRNGPGGSLKGVPERVAPAVEERSRSDTPHRMRGDSTGSSSNQSESSPQRLWRKATTRRTKPKVLRGECNSPQPPPKGPLLDVSIPEVRMERYSVFFQDVQSLPMRSSSLLARRQATGDKMKPLPGASLQTLNITPGALIRRATEPQSSTSSPSYTLFPMSNSPANRSTDRLPHIAQTIRRNPPHISTLHRPRPIKRTKTSPSSLRSPLVVNTTPKQQHRLSPAFEADELVPPRGRDDDSENDGLSPTPSTPASPSTPKSISASPPHRKNSWASSHISDPSWEMITVKKRYSPGDLFNASTTNVAAALNAIAIAETARASPAPPRRAAPTMPPIPKIAPVPDVDEDDDDDWVNDAPQVVVARSVSVTRANSQRKLFVRPTRVSSRNPSIPAPTATTVAAPTMSAASITSPSSIMSTAGHSVSSNGSMGSTNTSVSSSDAGGAITPVSPMERSASRLDIKRADLRREIWGEPRDVMDKKDEAWKENKALTPQMCVIDDDENRKSVWGLIETA